MAHTLLTLSIASAAVGPPRSSPVWEKTGDKKMINKPEKTKTGKGKMIVIRNGCRKVAVLHTLGTNVGTLDARGI